MCPSSPQMNKKEQGIFVQQKKKMQTDKQDSKRKREHNQ